MAWNPFRTGGDRQLAEAKYQGRESATDRAARLRREQHRARVHRDGDNAGTKIPRRLFPR
ncbi:hypothetical protein OG352_06235 [Streptomyces sp. NBC_01485]|uniref:hypothetical protein n=1 Tax=Streptomyces sp. NBC_01485 TaxID=2903884 RepID=UPI002E2F3754|nr:hypothetical protein [Streptomyces sp. NBC_01485]